MRETQTSKPAQPTADFLALYAAGIENGLILCCGNKLEGYARRIASAMPMTTRLLINVESGAGRTAAENLPATDIRIAVHLQETRSFLDDISRYLFNLVLLDHPERSPELAGILENRLMPDGMIMVLNTDIESIQRTRKGTMWHLVNTGWPDRAVLIRRQAESAQPSVRRGGRKARLRG